MATKRTTKAVKTTTETNVIDMAQAQDALKPKKKRAPVEFPTIKEVRTEALAGGKETKLPTPDERQELRSACRSYHDMQKLRVAVGNRIAASFRTKLGLSPSDAEESDAEAKKTLDMVRREYKRITDTITRITRSFKSDSTIITKYTEISLIESYEYLLAAEENAKNILQDLVEQFPIYNRYLSKIRGVGVVISAVLISEYDVVLSETVGKMWAKAGLDVVFNAEGEGQGRSKRKDHLVKRVYKNRYGEEIETVGITFSPMLKSTLVEIGASCFLRLGNQYTSTYYNYKHRLENHVKYKDVSKAHRDRMSKRYMMKIFIQDLYPVWREMYGLPVTLPYHEAKLGMVHHETGSVSKEV